MLSKWTDTDGLVSDAQMPCVCQICHFCRTGRETLNNWVWFPFSTAHLCCVQIQQNVPLKKENKENKEN